MAKSVFGVDLTAKHIFFELDGKEYSVCFRESLLKGVYDVSVYVSGRKTDAKITGTYPPFKNVIRDMQRIFVPGWLRRVLRLHNR